MILLLLIFRTGFGLTIEDLDTRFFSGLNY
jgi:hypothetical protein